MKTFLVVGGGAMGTACALLLAKNPDHRVTLWCRRDEHRREVEAARENRRFLPGVALPSNLHVRSDLRAGPVTAVVLAVPSAFLAETLARLRPDWPAGVPVVSVVKGMEQGTLRLPSAVAAAALGADVSVAILSGPSHAEEIARGLPASVVAAARDPALAEAVQRWFGGDRFRVYTTTDVVGVEAAGALKNVMALAAGICDGLGCGDNAKAALMTRGLVEMARVGVALGAEPETFYGLAGVGDLVTTCVSPHGRNRRVGELLGRGEPLAAVLAGTPTVAEGVFTAKSVHDLARRRGLDLPLTAEVHDILFAGKPPRAAVESLLQREPRPEREHFGAAAVG